MTEEAADKFRRSCLAHYMGMLDLNREAILELLKQCFTKPDPDEFDTKDLAKLVAMKLAADEYRRRCEPIPPAILAALTVLGERDVRTS